MTTQLEESIIYLAENRTTLANNSSQTQASQIKITERILAGGDFYHTSIGSDLAAVIIPYIGDVVVFSEKKKFLLQESDAIFGLTTDMQVSNPYLDDAIRFYEILLQKSILQSQEGVRPTQGAQNKLLAICPNVWIGQYDGRIDDVFKPKTNTERVFVFVIEGTFEIQGRLLQTNDGIEFWNTAALDFESLSDNALVLFVEFPEI